MDSNQAYSYKGNKYSEVTINADEANLLINSLHIWAACQPLDSDEPLILKNDLGEVILTSDDISNLHQKLLIPFINE